MIAVLGTLTVIFSVLAKIIGLPDQIKKNHQRRSTEGLSLTFFGIGFISYILWTMYGIIQSDLVIVLGQGLGVLLIRLI